MHPGGARKTHGEAATRPKPVYGGVTQGVRAIAALRALKNPTPNRFGVGLRGAF